MRIVKTPTSWINDDHILFDELLSSAWGLSVSLKLYPLRLGGSRASLSDATGVLLC